MISEEAARGLLAKYYPDLCVYYDDYSLMPKKLGVQYFDLREFCRGQGFADIRAWLQHNKMYRPIERDMRFGPSLELKPEDDSITIARKVFESKPLLGDVILNEKQKNLINEHAQKIFDRIQIGGTRSTEDDLVLVLSIVLLLRKNQESEEDEDDSFWPFIYRQFGYKHEDSSQSVYAALRSAVRNSLFEYSRYLAPEKSTQRYYTSLMMHALAPSESMESLFEILLYFFTDELNYDYIPEDPVFKSIVNCIAYRWDKAVEKDQSIHVRSNILASGLKVLFRERQVFMAQLCETIVRKIDALVRNQGATLLSQDSYLDSLLDTWYRKKDETQKAKLNQNKTAAKVTMRASSAEHVRIQYIMKDKKIAICIPAIRLETVADEEPVFAIYQGDELVATDVLDVYGRMCWTIRQKDLNLCDYSIDFDKLDSLRFVIQYEGKNLVDTKQALNRDYIIFDKHGHEISRQSMGNGKYYVLAPESAEIILSEGMGEYLLDHPGQLYELWVKENSSIQVNGVELVWTKRGKESFHHYSTSERVKGAYACDGGNQFSIYTHTPDISFKLPENTSPLQYRIRIDGEEKPLIDVCQESDSSFNLPVPDALEKVHLVQMIDWRNAKTVYEYRFVILNHFNCVLEKGIYLNDGTPIRGMVQYNDKLYDIEAMPEPDEDCIVVRIQDLDFDIKISIPLVRCSMGEENLLVEEQHIWHDEITKEDNIFVKAPPGWEKYLLFNGRSVPLASGSDDLFEFGNFEKSIGYSKDQASVDLVLRNDEGAMEHQPLMKIIYKPQVYHGLLYMDDNRGLFWQPEQGIICAKDAKFKMLLHISDNSEDDYVYSLTTKNERLCRSFDYDLGVFPYDIYLCGKQSMFGRTEDELIFSGELRIGNEDEIRLFGKVIHITTARRCVYYVNGKEMQENIELAVRSAWLSHFKYLGKTELPYDDEENETLPTFTADMYFYDQNNHKIVFNRNHNSENYELVNPVTIWLLNEHLLYLLTVTGDTVYLDKRYNSIVSRKLQLSRQEEKTRIRTPDLFEYNVTEESYALQSINRV